MQSLLVEKEEALRTVTLEKSRLEVEAEGFNQRLRSLNESEHRYKDENWDLEAQIQEHIAVAKESADREKRLTQALFVLQAEKAAAQKELDETKLNHARLAEDHATTIKHHDVELGSVKRNMTIIENEKGALQRKIDELTGQNQELAMAFSQQRSRVDERDQTRGLSDADFETAASNVTPEHSPPPSPVKGTPRHSMLESETVKSSLHHAHRMIQNLKGNIHREKTEKLELKRMLQDARDELEARRGDSLSSSATGRRNKKVDSKEFKKPLKPGQLGGLRSSRSEISMDDAEWEDHQGQGSTDHYVVAAGSLVRETGHESSDHFDTANEASDAFETANERGTETEDFHTGAEDLSGDDELTETEGGTVQGGTLRSKKPVNLALTQSGNRNSFQSTASLSGDDYSYEELKTPVQTQPQRLRLKMNRAGLRKSRVDSEEPNLNDSPASFASSSKDGTHQAPSQTLFAELEDLDGGSEEESIDGTPSRRSAISASGTPMSRPSTARQSVPARHPSPPLVSKPAMVDSGMMTERWEPSSATAQNALPYIAGASLAGVGFAEVVHVLDDKQEIPNTPAQPVISDTARKWHEDQLNNLLTTDLNASGGSRPISTSTYSNMSSQHDPDMEEKLAKFPSPPALPERTNARDGADLAPTTVPLSMSTILYEHVEPVADRPESGVFPTLNYGEISDPMRPPYVPVLPPMAFSSINAVSTEPVEPATSPGFQHEAVAGSDMKTQQTEIPKLGVLGSVLRLGRNKTLSTPIIAEDDTRQSPDQSPQAETPESQRPFKEISSNTNERAAKGPKVDMADESSQTALTGLQIDSMLKEKLRRQDMIMAEDGKAPTVPPARGTISSVTPRKRKSQESIGSVGRARAIDPDFAHDTISLRRPGSPGSNRGSVSSPHPPLPNDHKQVIAAAAQRVSSSSGGQGTMGPPPVPVSSYRANPAFRPRTPSFTSQNPVVGVIGRGGTTPRASVRASGNGELYTPSATGPRSRRSSVSSFVSEVDTRFNLRQNGMALPDGMDPSTDPRMIQAITQTMIGEYLWKYTRKTGRGEMSENRHRRYFWVHPYTRTLYWSDKDPSQAGRAELKAKSVAIEAVRVVTDDNPMPPGLHRKSLIILTPGRAVKFTAATGQRHETWFNALSYLLLRTAAEGTVGDRDEAAAGALTREDVDEFNPALGNRPTHRGPASLSSYNSRTTRNDSPARLSMQNSVRGPTLAHASNSSRTSTGTFKRFSNYWKPGKDGTAGAFGSRRTHESFVGNGSIYEASEVHDSAEDLRQIIEQQDRESDRLENVRACCDGKLRRDFL